MTTPLRNELNHLTTMGQARATASGQAFYVCWSDRWNRPGYQLTTEPKAVEQIVAVCLPEA